MQVHRSLIFLLRKNTSPRMGHQRCAGFDFSNYHYHKIGYCSNCAVCRIELCLYQKLTGQASVKNNIQSKARKPNPEKPTNSF